MIEIQDLTKVFSAGGGRVTALQDVSLTIRDGDIYGIIGMSGAGKSTLLRCLSMLEEPTHGRILLDGEVLSGLHGAKKREAHRKMGVMFQGYNLLMQRTVAQNVAFPLKLVKGYDRAAVNARVEELLGLVGLTDKRDAYPSQLSGGQKQRVALARALAANPKVLLADEPTSALDPLTTRSVLELLRDVNRKLGITIIIITHEIGVVKRICSHVAVIDDSHVVEAGAVADILDNPQSEIAQSLLHKGGVPHA